MSKILIAFAWMILFAAPASATPLIPVSTFAHAAVQSDDIIQVKRKAKARPYGWSKGRKVGWRGRSMPPGQAKKFR
jgi:hypothetical protein